MADRNDAIQRLMALAELSKKEQAWLRQFAENPHLVSDITTHATVIAELLETQTVLLRNFMLQMADIDDKIVEVRKKLNPNTE